MVVLRCSIRHKLLYENDPINKKLKFQFNLICRMLMSVDSSLSYSSSTLSSPMTSPSSPDPATDWPSVTSSSNVNNVSKIDESVNNNQQQQQQHQESEEEDRKAWKQKREMAMSFLDLTEKQLDDLNLELKETAASLSLALSVKNDHCGRPQRDFDYLLVPKSMSVDQEDALVTESN
jgi:hypothetical protein